jgi:glycine cleavage system H lipoate-binding protein
MTDKTRAKQNVIARNEMTKQTREIVNENNHKEYWIASLLRSSQ